MKKELTIYWSGLRPVPPIRGLLEVSWASWGLPGASWGPLGSLSGASWGAGRSQSRTRAAEGPSWALGAPSGDP